MSERSQCARWVRPSSPPHYVGPTIQCIIIFAHHHDHDNHHHDQALARLSAVVVLVCLAGIGNILVILSVVLNRLKCLNQG